MAHSPHARLELNCEHCGAPTQLDIVDWVQPRDRHLQPWQCPTCDHAHVSALPGIAVVVGAMPGWH